MNIFFLDHCPRLAARSLGDIHTGSQPKEAGQILHAGAYRLGYRDGRNPYNPAGRFARWAVASRANWDWLVEHSLEAEAQKRIRYGAGHAAADRIRSLASSPEIGALIPPGDLTPFPHAIKRDGEQIADVVGAYRLYYATHKRHLARWDRGVPAPEWWPET